MDLDEHWPLGVGLAIIVIGHVYFAIAGIEFSLGSPLLLLALAVVLVLEAGRWLYRRWG